MARQVSGLDKGIFFLRNGSSRAGQVGRDERPLSRPTSQPISRERGPLTTSLAPVCCTESSAFGRGAAHKGDDCKREYESIRRHALPHSCRLPSLASLSACFYVAHTAVSQTKSAGRHTIKIYFQACSQSCILISRKQYLSVHLTIQNNSGRRKLPSRPQIHMPRRKLCLGRPSSPEHPTHPSHECTSLRAQSDCWGICKENSSSHENAIVTPHSH